MSEVTEKVINGLLEKNANLEWEVERLQDIIDRTLQYIKNNNLYIGAFNSYTQPIVDILTGEDKKKKEKSK